VAVSAAGARARVFVALPLGAELAARVAAAVEETLPRAAWRPTRPEALHATLAFHGELPREALPELRAALEGELAAAEAPALRLGGTGAFPGLARASVLWIGIAERARSGCLAACQRAVAAAFAGAGIALADAERPFRPHLTVARARRPRTRAPEEFAALALEESWDPPAVVLYESIAEAGGHRHAPLAWWRFVDAP
jgi:2'-5' RNA ligase